MPIFDESYQYVRQCIGDEALEILREEADHLFHLNCIRETLSEDEYFDKGCALDFFTNNELPDDDEARLSMDAYMSKRGSASCNGGQQAGEQWSGCEQATGDTPTATGAIKRGFQPSMGLQDDYNCGTPYHRASILEGVIFRRLAGLAQEALVSECLARERCIKGEPVSVSNVTPLTTFSTRCHTPQSPPQSSSRPSQTALAEEKWTAGRSDEELWSTQVHGKTSPRVCASREESRLKQGRKGDAFEVIENPDTATVVAANDIAGKVFLFNEQYVVKPPQSSLEFGWHTDEREQLAMRVESPAAVPPAYVSVWLALDDCDSANGCLEVYPQPATSRRMGSPGKEEEADVVCLPSKAGDAVVFLSSLWHRSGPNRTVKPRRVFYAQYSKEVICAMPRDPRPLSLAIPCLVSSGLIVSSAGGRVVSARETGCALSTVREENVGGVEGEGPAVSRAPLAPGCTLGRGDALGGTGSGEATRAATEGRGSKRRREDVGIGDHNSESPNG